MLRASVEQGGQEQNKNPTNFFRKGLDIFLKRIKIVTMGKSGHCGMFLHQFGLFELFVSFISYEEVGGHIFSVWGSF